MIISQGVHGRDHVAAEHQRPFESRDDGPHPGDPRNFRDVFPAVEPLLRHGRLALFSKDGFNGKTMVRDVLIKDLGELATNGV